MLLVKPALNFPDGPWITLLEKAYMRFDECLERVNVLKADLLRGARSDSQ